jgi:di/tricarboxylate transporter
MTSDLMVFFLLFAVTIGFLVWGRVRHDLVAAASLLLAVILGVVPPHEAFRGFSNEAVFIVALALIASRALENSGALASLGRFIGSKPRPLAAQIALISGLGAALSSVMNNVAALALLMPIDIEASRNAKRPPGLTLMPLAYATILGGIVTLIGTPPNIVISAIREQRIGAGYSLFDFTPVGLIVAAAGLAFVATVGWRLVPRREDQAKALVESNSFRAQLRVPATSNLLGITGVEFEEQARNVDAIFLGAIRARKFFGTAARSMAIEANDILVVEGSTDAIAALIKSGSLHQADGGGAGNGTDAGAVGAAHIVEAVLRADAPIIGSTPRSLALRNRYDITLLGVARRGIIRRSKLGDQPLEAGNILLLSGGGAQRNEVLTPLGLIAINKTPSGAFKPRDAAIVAGVFIAAIAVASSGLLPFTLALLGAVIVYAGLGIVPASEIYTKIEWPIVIMLACLLPLGTAFDSLGGARLVADGLVALAPSSSPLVVLVILMTLTTLMCAVLNNVAVALIFGPVAIDVAQGVQAAPDSFLMGVVIAASCAFLSPIGHKNNLLIMGPGGFQFGDYWRLGAPLTVVVFAVAVPALLHYWPL